MMMSLEAPTYVARWPMLRLQAGSKCDVQLLSGDWVRLVTHFSRRTFLCAEVDECDACNVLPGRAYWYLPVLHLEAKRQAILELSCHASADLVQRCRFVGFAIRAGVQVALSRRSKKAPLGIEVMDQAEGAPLAKLHEWVSALMLVYKLPGLLPGESVEVYGARVKDRVLARAKVMADLHRASAKGRV